MAQKMESFQVSLWMLMHIVQMGGEALNGKDLEASLIACSCAENASN